MTIEAAVVEKVPVFAMVVGEASGDILGSGLVKSLKKHFPNARFVGIGGPLMIEQGFESFYPMERLSVMGLVEVLGRIFELLRIRKSLREHFIALSPEVFIGIDAPDFNLGLARQLKAHGMKTAHYVSPSVWAWRQNRVHGIAKSIDLMLALFPFEASFYEQHQIEVKCVGHPLADEIPLEPDKTKAREALGIALEGTWVTVMPGSRGGEVSRLGPLFFEAIRHMSKLKPNLSFLIPCANPARKKQIEEIQAGFPGMTNVLLIDGQSREAMTAGDAVLLASGTASLEAMLLKRPMVVAYRVAKITYWLMRRLLKVPYVSLPNLLSNQALVPELIQDNATPKRLAKETIAQLNPDSKLIDIFQQRHLELKLDASEEAAAAVAQLVHQQ